MPLRQAIDMLHEELWFLNREMVPYYRDVAGHLLRSVELADNVRDSLTTILEVRTAQASNQLKRGDEEAHRLGGIILALGMMAVSSTVLYIVFKRNDWL